MVRGVLLDIEGTTSSISFVYDEMFPLVRRDLATFLQTNWESPDIVAACDQIAREAGADSLEAWCAGDPHSGREFLVREVTLLMDADAKTTGLKQLQGLIWRDAFNSGELQAHLFEDVQPAMQAWNELGIRQRIYSSGSIGAQKLFFGHTVAGDLLHFLEGHYDTTTGPKSDPASYTAIANDWDLPAEQIVFLTDIPAEANAAQTAGMKTAICLRPGNAPVPSDPVPSDLEHPTIRSFAELALA